MPKIIEERPVEVLPRRRADKEAPAWWLWPHLCSLDAPLVAVVWQRWWAHGVRVDLSWHKEAILALAVWLMYLADRWADTGGSFPPDHETARHRFYLRHRTATGIIACMLIALLTVLTPRWLTPREFAAGIGLLALAGGYFTMTHRRVQHSWTAFLPKEAAVGGLFALGSCAFVLMQLREMSGPLVLALAGFAGLCFLNCALIARWENSARDWCDPASLLNAFPIVVRGLLAFGIVLAASALLVSFETRSGLLIPLGLSSLLLVLLDLGQARLSINALRVLADVVLLTPLLCFLALRLG